jgi:hypothetical protein
MAADKDRDPPMSFRASKIVREQIKKLEAKMGENKSRVIVRAVAELYARIFPEKK